LAARGPTLPTHPPPKQHNLTCLLYVQQSYTLRFTRKGSARLSCLRQLRCAHMVPIEVPCRFGKSRYCR